MFTIYFIIGFILFCLACLEAIDDLTICDYRKQIKLNREKIKELSDEYDALMACNILVNQVDPLEFQTIIDRINTLEKEIESLYIELNTYPRFYKR